MNQCRINSYGNTVSPQALVWLLSIAPLIAHGGAAEVLTLPAAEQYALQADPAVIASHSRAVALQEQAIADGQLPDPKLGLGIYNLPLNDFSVSREPTTQFRTKIQQAFPRGDTLSSSSGGRSGSGGNTGSIGSQAVSPSQRVRRA